MSKLVCSKCGGTLFKNSNHHVVLTVYVHNGLPPRQEGYICANCGHEEIVTYPAVYFEEPKPFEVDLPEDNKPQPLTLDGSITMNDPEGNLFDISNCERLMSSGIASGAVCVDDHGYLVYTEVKK